MRHPWCDRAPSPLHPRATGPFTSLCMLLLQQWRFSSAWRPSWPCGVSLHSWWVVVCLERQGRASWAPTQIGAPLLQEGPCWHLEASKWPGWPGVWGVGLRCTTPRVPCFTPHMKHKLPTTIHHLWKRPFHCQIDLLSGCSSFNYWKHSYSAFLKKKSYVS